jgi:activating signal cointegrator complex subunit 2
LGRKVFLTMLRLVNDGARERSCLTLEERRQAVLKHNLIDVPKLIDLTVIYGSDNRDLVHEVLENAVKLLPTLEDDFGRTGLMIEKNLKDMAARVTPAAEANELPPDGLSESLSYFHDVAISLVSLVTVYPEAAEWLRRDGNLTGALEKIRSMVLSSFQSMATCDSDSLDTVRGSLGAAISFLRSADGGGGGGGGGGGEEEEEEEEMENPWMQSAIST